jgi:hypothetical protein
MSMTIDELYEIAKAAREAGHGTHKVLAEDDISALNGSLATIKSAYTDSDNNMVLELF